VIDGWRLGERLSSSSDNYRQFQCGPSDQFAGLTWCQKQDTNNNGREDVTSSTSILHDRDGSIVYLNRYIEPAFFSADDVHAEIERLSAKYGKARLIAIPQRDTLPDATIAVWGNLRLEPLGDDDVAVLARGDSPHRGILVSFLGDLERSAKAQVPIFRVTGGQGFVWAATFNKESRGVLRFFAIDASRLAPPSSEVVAHSSGDERREGHERPASDDITRASDTIPPVHPDGLVNTCGLAPAIGGGRDIPIAGRTIRNEKRVALVIGNSNYQHAPCLPNPMRDAELMAKLFGVLGFRTVHLRDNVTRADLVSALRTFEREAADADWAVVYFAGHGIQIDGINYLIPTDAVLQSDRDVALETIDLNSVLRVVDARLLNLVILDACRENPFLSRMRSVATRSIPHGLAEEEPSKGTLVAFSARDGQTALDGNAVNSPFVQALATRLVTPQLEIRRMFDLVRDDVMLSTDNRQQPFTYGSLSGSRDYYFVPK
jgi:hypothetical protein